MTVRAQRRPGRPAGGQPVVDREQLLDAAERAIARDGAGVSLDAIAAEAGVTKPMVYARVGDRGELADMLAERLAERLVHAGGAVVGEQRLGQASLAALFGATLETIGAHRQLFLYVTGGSSADHPGRTLHLAGTSVDPLAQLLASWRANQGKDPSVALPWAYGIVGMLNLVALWWIDDDSRPVTETAEQLAALAWSGIDGP